MKQTNRWVLLVFSIMANLSIGSAYAWSVFAKPLMKQFGWTSPQVSIAFTLSLGLVPIAMIIAGRISDKIGPRWVIFGGGIIFGSGIFLASFTSSLTTLYLSYGLIGGLGIGTIYGTTIPNTTKWFPDRRGLAGGLIAGGFGIGSVIFGPLSAQLISSMGVLNTFRLEGILYVVVVVIASFFITAPPAGYKPAGWNPPVASPTAPGAVVDMAPSQMLKTSRFYILFLMYVMACFAGLMIIGHASPIGQEVVGLSAAVAAGAVAFLSLANTTGRVFWGAVSDKLGRYNTLLLMYTTSGLSMLLLSTASTYWTYVIGIMGVALAFGGFFGIFPSITAENFGTKNLGNNYGVLFISYGIAAVFAPMLAAFVKQSTGGYNFAFAFATGAAVAGILLTLFIKSQVKKQQKNSGISA